MGWCDAFGPQIREGCDHAMVAGDDSCSCAQCGAVCYGMFAGCASVWAAGPRQATITRPGKDSAGLAPVVEPGAAVAQSPADASELRALRADLQVLMRKLDQLQQATPAGDELVRAAKDVGVVARALPQQVQEAVSEALATQRKAARQMFSQIEQEIRLEIGQFQESLQRERQRPVSPPAAPALSVADLDTRFQWLVEAVSERLITLGNGLSRIERQIGSETAAPNGAPTDGATINGSSTNGSSTNDFSTNRASTGGAGGRGTPVKGTPANGPTANRPTANGPTANGPTANGLGTHGNGSSGVKGSSGGKGSGGKGSGLAQRARRGAADSEASPGPAGLPGDKASP